MTNATFAVHTTLKYNLQYTINFVWSFFLHVTIIVWKEGQNYKKKIHDSEKLSSNLFTKLNNLWLK